MRKCGVAIAMTSAALATLSLAAPAHATNNDLFVCRMTDTHHNALVYSFGYNTMASRGAQGAGTYVEVAFAKNGQFVSSPVGSRPIWTWADNVNGGAIVQNNDPRYAMGIKYDPRRRSRPSCATVQPDEADCLGSPRHRGSQSGSGCTSTRPRQRLRAGACASPLSPLTRVMSRDRLLPLLQLRLRLRLWWLRLRLCPTAWPWNQTVPTGKST